MTTNQRQQKGQAIAQVDGHVTRIDENTYRVKSQSDNSTEYDVIAGELGWLCSCPDHIYRGQKCKHIFAVDFSLSLRKVVVAQVRRIEPVHTTTANNCIYCKSSKVVKGGIRHNKRGDIQIYNCKDCDRYFTINLGFEKMHATPQMITSAMQLYFTGESFRNVQKFLRLQGVNVSHTAVYKWINKYVSFMQKYLEKITPNVSGAWRSDELYLKIKGNTKYLYAVMDDETRFCIAQQVADSKYTSDIDPLFKKAKQVAGNKRPNALITDGAQNFHLAYLNEFWTRKGPRTKHIREISFKGKGNRRHNNKMERFNGEVRDREKAVRGLKKTDTVVLKGYQLYHNYLRPHEGLDGKTPADACGIKIEGENKWITLIQNAFSHKVGS
jgi:putative transposase